MNFKVVMVCDIVLLFCNFIEGNKYFWYIFKVKYGIG